MIRHVNPSDKKMAVAPYNFVPLPHQIYTVTEGIEVNGKRLFPWKMHDRFGSGTFSGWIELSIRTLTPLYIRGAMTRKDGKWDNRDIRLRPEPCMTQNGKPMIPGSSLRGMIRTLVEILSFSKIAPVTDEKPFFRTMATDRIGIAYRNRMIRGDQKPMGGYMRKRGNQWTIAPAKEVLRVHRDTLNNLNLKIPHKPDPNYFPSWTGQHKDCYFKRDVKKNWKVAKITFDQSSGYENGTLVLTGSSPKKEYDFIFVGKETSSAMLIPEMVWSRFHDEDQLTRWQEKAFPKDKPSLNCRKTNGHLREGEPVFFLTDASAKSEKNPSGLVFFGRAQMFRFPYDRSPSNLVPEKIKNAGLDMAEAMFGMVNTVGKKNQAVKGRVSFEDAIAENGGQGWFEEIIVPRILASPKVTCFQHYLIQNGNKGQRELTTYLNDDKTTVRGHKLYWHRWDDDRALNAIKEPRRHDSLRSDLLSGRAKDSQHTIIRPVKSNVAFSSRIRFENLTPIELGALLSALQIPDGCAHKLGMGRSLGLGSVKVDSQLHIVDPNVRYSCWQDTGTRTKTGGVFIKSFEKAMIEHARSSKETIDESKSGLKRIARLQGLFHILQWIERPGFSETNYMKLQDFRYRPILPTPHRVVGKQEPAWQSDPPRSAKQETLSATLESIRKPIAKAPKFPHTQAAKPVEKGQTRNGRLKHSSDRWIALFEGDSREAVIVNQNKIPPKTVEDCVAEFYITEQSKKSGIKARFEKLA